MTEKELRTLFEKKLAEWEIPFNEANWEAFNQMVDPSEPMSEQEFSKLFKDKMEAATFPFNAKNWEALEEELGPEGGMNTGEMSDLFDKKLSESSFAFNEENWNRMEHLLDEQDRKPLAFYWRSAAAILILALTTTAIWWPKSATDPNTPLDPARNAAVESPQNTFETPEMSEQGATVKTDQPQGSDVKASKPMATQTSRQVKSQQSPSIKLAGSQLTNTRLTPPAEFTSVEDRLAYQNLEAKERAWNALPPLKAHQPSLRELSLDPDPATSVKVEPYIPQVYSELLVLAGPNISAGFNGKTGGAWQAGLVYRYGLNANSALELGAIYNQARVGIETMHDSTFFGLASTNVSTHRHYKQLASIRVPLNFRASLSKSHHFNVGVYADFLLRVQMDETVQTTIFKQEPRIVQRSYNQAMESFNSFNYGAVFSYQYQYSELLSVGLSYQMGLSDLTKNEAFGFASSHRPDQLNLELRYRLMKR